MYVVCNGQVEQQMRPFSLYSAIAFVVCWTLFVLLMCYLISSRDTSLTNEEAISKIEAKIDNFDARNIRVLEQIRDELKVIENVVLDTNGAVRHGDQPRAVGTERPLLPARVQHPAPVIPVLVMACNRPSYTQRALDSLLKHRPSPRLFPVYVSQDCGHQPTADVISKYGSQITHMKQPNQSGFGLTGKKKAQEGYYKISRHYRWALGQVFSHNYSSVIVTEDDIEVAPDFFSYFSSLWPLLASDSSLLCVSAWNDNGKESRIDIKGNDLLYRSDFFPGLGWMMTRDLWSELLPKWPDSFWDDWMREPDQRKGRACIRPEVSRTSTFGEQGVSHGQFFKDHLRYIVMNKDPVDFEKLDLSYLQEDQYQKVFVEHVLSLPVLTTEEVFSNKRTELKEVQVHYLSGKDFTAVAKQLKIMSDLKAGMPRTAYKGIVSFIFNGRRVHLTKYPQWTGYL